MTPTSSCRNQTAFLIAISAVLCWFSCATTQTLVTPAPAEPGVLEVRELVLRAKDGTIRGRLRADGPHSGLTLTDAAGNSVSLSVEEECPGLTLWTPRAHVNVRVEDDNAALAVSTQTNHDLVWLGATFDGGQSLAMADPNGEQRLMLAVVGPQAGLETYDAAGKRRSSLGLNSDGAVRFSLYDSNERRRIYALLGDDGTPTIDFNDSEEKLALRLYGAHPRHGSGMAAFPKGSGDPAALLGVGPEGKAQRLPK